MDRPRQDWADFFRARATSNLLQVSLAIYFIPYCNNQCLLKTSPLQITESNSTHTCLQLQCNFFMRKAGTSNNNVNNVVMWHPLHFFLNSDCHPKIAATDVLPSPDLEGLC